MKIDTVDGSRAGTGLAFSVSVSLPLLLPLPLLSLVKVVDRLYSQHHDGNYSIRAKASKTYTGHCADSGSFQLPPTPMLSVGSGSRPFSTALLLLKDIVLSSKAFQIE